MDVLNGTGTDLDLGDTMVPDKISSPIKNLRAKTDLSMSGIGRQSRGCSDHFHNAYKMNFNIPEQLIEDLITNYSTRYNIEMPAVEDIEPGEGSIPEFNLEFDCFGDVDTGVLSKEFQLKEDLAAHHGINSLFLHKKISESDKHRSIKETQQNILNRTNHFRQQSYLPTP